MDLAGSEPGLRKKMAATSILIVVLAWLVVLGLAGVLTWQVLQLRQRRRPPHAEETTAEALHILEQRYARGEIGQAEFEERRRTLLQS